MSDEKRTTDDRAAGVGAADASKSGEPHEDLPGPSHATGPDALPSQEPEPGSALDEATNTVNNTGPSS